MSTASGKASPCAASAVLTSAPMQPPRPPQLYTEDLVVGRVAQRAHNRCHDERRDRVGGQEHGVDEGDQRVDAHQSRASLLAAQFMLGRSLTPSSAFAQGTDAMTLLSLGAAASTNKKVENDVKGLSLFARQDDKTLS